MAIGQVYAPNYSLVQFFYPDPHLRAAVTGENTVNAVAQATFVRNYQSLATKAFVHRSALYSCCVVAGWCGATALITASVVYSYVAVAALVAVYVLKRHWVTSPLGLHEQAFAAAKSNDTDSTIRLLDRGAYRPSSDEDEYHNIFEEGSKDVIRHMLSLGLGTLEDIWNADDSDTAQAFVESGLLRNLSAQIAFDTVFWELESLANEEFNPSDLMILHYYFQCLNYTFNPTYLANYDAKDRDNVHDFLGKALGKTVTDPSWPQVQGTLRTIQGQLSISSH